MNLQQRQNEQREIKAFVTCAFQEKSKFDLEHFSEFNSKISSEMFVSVMSILQERLPSSNFYFRQRRNFKSSYCSAAQLNIYSAGLSIDTTNVSSEKESSLRDITNSGNTASSFPSSPVLSSNVTAIA